MTTSPETGPDLRYPIGKLARKSELTSAERASAVDTIALAPHQLRRAVEHLSDEQLDTPYRPGGWTVRQLVHHVADSHMNAYTRFRLALTEDNPTIKPYDEARWAELEDARTLPIGVSLDLLDRMHERLDVLLRATPAEKFSRTVSHPENGPTTLDALLNTYAWHGRHHTAHVTALRERMGWS
ncbi:MAG: putative metal-dependent hydrolase [Gemmatimonadota bacterium]|nr:putative metal-dependent hydrolase [Gemmatimonadota bacterium]